ncbi:LysR family transcriptional regulator [Allokutzneria albata]|uniref:DNA-binding transcriptional regulator, LysR family n=1 Tax=Allokutzneria albata TaxID=211114 RepID=A0A1G9S698_ALLAB|nr:LysR substrate-binding domain-containing protein [Allokutzneria albata]SDM31043.1 DNA-binding transcriptional regulator, LysR family [Allokutzneria albata]
MTQNLSKIDLNLLVPLNALLKERNVTRAAEWVSVGQPAMSASLARLRRLFNDPLLVKDGRQMVLTPLAESLVPRVTKLLADIGVVMSAAAQFDPATAERVFAVTASDYVTAVLLRPLLRELLDTAPGVRLSITSLHAGFVDHLRKAQCDLLIWPLSLPTGEEVFPHGRLFSDTFVAVVDGDNPDVGERLSADQLADAPYVMVGGPHRAITDGRFDESGVYRNVVANTETFSGAAHLVPGTRMVAVIQRRLADLLGPRLGLRTVELAVPMPELVESMYWHPKSSVDPGHRWLRETVQRVAARL